MNALAGDWVRVPTKTNKNQLVHVPRGQCWVEGDNSNSSRDSGTSAKQIPQRALYRAPATVSETGHGFMPGAFGAVPVALLTGQVSYVVWPPWRVRALSQQLPEGRDTIRGSAEDDTANDTWFAAWKMSKSNK